LCRAISTAARKHARCALLSNECRDILGTHHAAQRRRREITQCNHARREAARFWQTPYSHVRADRIGDHVRYHAHLPSGREVVIFDRSWYNRAGVEPVMSFCTPAVGVVPPNAEEVVRRQAVDREAPFRRGVLLSGNGRVRREPQSMGKTAT
jgi:hypothetical protein